MFRSVTGLGPYLKQLESLPFVRSVAVRAPPHAQQEHDAVLELETTAGTHSFLLTEFKSHISASLARQLVHLTGTSDHVVFAPHIGRDLGATLAKAGFSYLDRQGNCHFEIARKIYFHVEGRPTARTEIASRGMRSAGYYALFGYLADPTLLNATVRAAAEAIGVSRQAVFDMRRRLLAEGSIVRTTAGLRWVPRRRLDELQRWLIGYKTTVRPSLFLGSYRTRDDSPGALEQRIEHLLTEKHFDWAFGGTAAAARLVGHYRGDKTVVHVAAAPSPPILKLLHALPAPDGPLVFLHSFGNLDWKLGSKIAHPLLVYAELLVCDDERAAESADLILRHHVQPLWGTE